MVIAKTTGADGKPILILGLSEGNIQCLKEGKPIAVEGAHLGFSGKIYLMYGETEQHIAAEINAHVNSEGPN